MPDTKDPFDTSDLFNQPSAEEINNSFDIPSSEWSLDDRNTAAIGGLYNMISDHIDTYGQMPDDNTISGFGDIVERRYNLSNPDSSSSRSPYSKNSIADAIVPAAGTVSLQGTLGEAPSERDFDDGQTDTTQDQPETETETQPTPPIYPPSTHEMDDGTTDTSPPILPPTLPVTPVTPTLPPVTAPAPAPQTPVTPPKMDPESQWMYDTAGIDQNGNSTQPSANLDPPKPMPRPTDGPYGSGTSGGQSKPGGNNGKVDLTPEEGQKIVDQAKTWNGTPYGPIGSGFEGSKAQKGSDGGADCSGSVHHIFQETGKDYSYTPSGSFAEAAATGKIPFREISADEKQPGDVVLYPGHMGISEGKSTNNGADSVIGAHRQGIEFGSAPETSFKGTPRYFRYIN
jgi:cell wall-associated NlpC family hydrolase